LKARLTRLKIGCTYKLYILYAQYPPTAQFSMFVLKAF